MKKAAIFTIAILALAFFTTNSNAQTQGKGNYGVVKTNWVYLNSDGKKDGTENPIRPMGGKG